jgi:hypothetical protein
MAIEEVRLAIETPPEPAVPDQGQVITADEERAEVTPKDAPPPATEPPPQEAPKIPEKFKSVEELAKAYEELERKLGQQAQPPAPPAPPADSGQPTEAQVAADAAALAVAQAVTEAAGGEAALQEVVAWARENLPQADREAFDAALDTGNPVLAKMAMAQVSAAFRAENPVEPSLVRGTPAPASGDIKPYGSRLDVVRAMSDPRYDQGDPAYHAEVMRRLAVSPDF